MAGNDEVYDPARAERLRTLLRSLAEEIRHLDQGGDLLARVPDLIRLLGEARSELFQYEVRATYDTPELAEHRRLVEEAMPDPGWRPDETEDDEPWRHPPRH
jgi:hypothetical protein